MEKRNKIIYWIATSLLAFGMLSSGIFQLIRSKEMVDMLTQLGYPLYFMTILGIWKILGVVAILIPRFPVVKEWAYAGFFFAMTGAFISHVACADYDVKALLGPLMQTLFIVLSWYFRPASRKLVANGTSK